MNPGLRLDGYVRVSKVGGREGEGFISPQVQADALTKWANGHGHHLTLHEPELDRSGGTMDRPVFNQIMRRIESGDSQGILVYKVDRFARSLFGALSTLEAIAEAGGTFASVSDNVDLTTAQGRAFLHMQLVFAQLFRDQVAEGFHEATKRAVARGVHISNVTPRGFDRGDDGVLVPNDEAPVIRELFERRASGEGGMSLARWMDAQLPRPNGEQWTSAHVRRLLDMRVYLGEAHYGQHRNRNAHKAIVSPDLFERASAARAAVIPRGDIPILLSGLVRCAGCRYVMTPSKSGPNGETLTYRCREKHTAGRCPEPATIVRARVDNYVERMALAKMRDHAITATRETPDMAEAMSRRDALAADLDEFAVDATSRALLGDRYHTVMQAKADALRAADAQVAALTASTSLPDVSAEEWADWPVKDRNAVLTQMIDAVFVRKMKGKPPVEARTLVVWRDELHDDLPRRGRVNGPVRPFTDWPVADPQARMATT